MKNKGSRIEMKTKNKNSGINTISRDIIEKIIKKKERRKILKLVPFLDCRIHKVMKYIKKKQHIRK